MLLPNHPAGRAPQEDAGVFLYSASVLLDGGLPYRDVWDHKLPLVYVLDALGLALGGGSEQGVWWLQAAGYVAAALLGHRALVRVLGLAAGTFGSVAWLLAAPRLYVSEDFVISGIGYFTNPVQLFAAPLQFGALALMVDEDARAGAGWRTAAIGALGGLAFLLTPTLGGLWVAIALAWLIARRGEARRRLFLLVAGGGAVVAVAFAYFAARGGLADLVDQALLYNFLYSARSSTPSGRAYAIVTGLRLTSYAGVAAVAALGWLIALAVLVRSRGGSARPLLLVGVLGLPLEILLAATSGRPYGYYFLAWLPALAILSAQFAHWSLSAAPARLRVRPGLAALALSAVLVVMAVRSGALLVRMAASREDGTARVAAARIVATTNAGDTVFVWGSRTEVNFLSGRRSPTRFVYQYAPLYSRGYTSADRVEELLRDLERRPPILILDASRSSPVTPALEREAILMFDTRDPLFGVPPELLRVVDRLETHYTRVEDVEHSGWPVYRLRAAP